MQKRHAQRDEEHPQHLRIDGGFDLPVVHADLLQNIELRLVVIALTCAAFMLLYLIVYKLTARVYYRIVRW